MCIYLPINFIIIYLRRMKNDYKPFKEDLFITSINVKITRNISNKKINNFNSYKDRFLNCVTVHQ